MEYRNDKKLTIKQFLEICGLPKKKVHIFNSFPVNQGQICILLTRQVGFRESIFKSDRVEVTEYSVDLNIDCIIWDLKYNEFDKFQELGILRVFLREDESIFVSCLKTADD